MVTVLIPSSAGYERAVAHARRSLFLHFVNRELHRLKKFQHKEPDHIQFLKICALMSSGTITAPFAQFNEIYFKKKNINELFQQLFYIDKAYLYNGSQDYETFRESRQQLYHGFQSRYEMYFDRVHHNRSLFRASLSLDTTAYIKGNLLSAIKTPDNAGNFFGFADLSRLKINQEFILNDLQEKPLGATFTVFERSSIEPKPAETIYFGQVSSRIFIKHYSTEHDLIVPTGYINDHLVEDFDHFPFFDIEIHRCLFDKIGLGPIIRDMSFHKPFINIVSDNFFNDFCISKCILLQGIVNTLGGVSSQNAARIINRINEMDFRYQPSSRPLSSAILIERINSIIGQNTCVYPALVEAQKYMAQIFKPHPPVLLFTATDVEDEILRAFLTINGFTFKDLEPYSGFSAAAYLCQDRLQILHVRTSAGSFGAHSSARISELAINQIKPCFVFSVGIAFGLIEKSQSPRDVLVSETVQAYESAKITNGKYEARGPKIPTSPDVVSYARHYDLIDNSFKVHVGAILSGEKLVNDDDFRKILLEIDGKAIGGEMESAGLVQSCQILGSRFAMIKGISDFAVGKNDDSQREAAENAFKLFFAIIDKFNKKGVFVGGGD